MNFELIFETLTGHKPFPWQCRLFEAWRGCISSDFPAITLPTGVGKTSVIPIWLIALAQNPSALPRRLVYVVNRRTVVDQTTEEVENLAKHISLLPEIDTALRKLCSICLTTEESPLALSTLRGKKADNRTWSADPSRPAVIVGTVDMIGSRLLFGGYRIGFKSRPLHAAFLAQHTVIIHDEAHLEPAFQRALESIREEQDREKRRSPKADALPLRIVALTATSRTSDEKPFQLDPASDYTNPVVSQRMHAVKRLELHEEADYAKDAILGEHLARRALAHESSGQTILIFAQKLNVLNKAREQLTNKDNKVSSERIRMLTGTLRGYERDALVKDSVFQRFLPEAEAADGETVYLLCTSAGEVGINLSAKHLVCDLTTYESMAQRFGRVNRFGDPKPLPEDQQTRIDVVYPQSIVTEKIGQDEKNRAKIRKFQYQEAQARTLALLRSLQGNASPAQLDKLPAEDRAEAFSSPPDILPITDILLDNWAMTSIREALPGRPPLEPYLHGVDEAFDPPRTFVAWRQEVEVINTNDLLALYPPDKLLDDFPLKPHELLSDNSDRVHAELKKIIKRLAKEGKVSPADITLWVVDEYGRVAPHSLEELENRPELIQGRTLLLPPGLGGLSDGMLDGSKEAPVKGSLDVADAQENRKRVWGDAPPEGGPWRRVRQINLSLESAGEDGEDDTEDKQLHWTWYELKWGGDGTHLENATRAVPLEEHGASVEIFAELFARKLDCTEEEITALRLAGRWHDLGKRRTLWQRSIGNHDPSQWLAKSGPGMKYMHLSEYRHEFGSLLDCENETELSALSEEGRDLVLHLIAAHHGRARPHFTAAECTDPERGLILSREKAQAVPHRFARLQRRYGRWGLAWLESLLRAADYAASAERTPHPDLP